MADGDAGAFYKDVGHFHLEDNVNIFLQRIGPSCVPILLVKLKGLLDCEQNFDPN